jgi:hypothetical protein
MISVLEDMDLCAMVVVTPLAQRSMSSSANGSN